MILNIEAYINSVAVKPAVKEDEVSARGAITLSRKIKELSTGAFSVVNSVGGSILVECRLD